MAVRMESTGDAGMGERAKGDLRALGLAGFGLPLFVASVAWAGFFPEERAIFALPLAIVLGAATAAAAAIGYRIGDSFSGTMLGVLGAFWLSWAALEWMIQSNFLALGTDTNGLLATFFGAWAVLTAIIVVAAWADTVVDMLVMTGAALVFAGLCVGYAVDHTGWMKAAGWVGIATSIICGYAVLADVVNAAWERTILPVVQMPHPTHR